MFEASRALGVAKLVAAGSACAYPRATRGPVLGGRDLGRVPRARRPRPTGSRSACCWCSPTPTAASTGFDSCSPVLVNLYGPGDNYDPEDSHVVAAMIRKYVEAERDGADRVVLWGTGEPTREFLHVDDAARALLLAAERYESSDPVNIGTGREVRIRDLAELISGLSGYRGETVWDRRAAGRPSAQVPGREPGARADRVRGRGRARAGAAGDDRELPRGERLSRL